MTKFEKLRSKLLKKKSLNFASACLKCGANYQIARLFLQGAIKSKKGKLEAEKVEKFLNE